MSKSLPLCVCLWLPLALIGCRNESKVAQEEQTRSFYEYLSEKYDADDDGRISLAEYPRKVMTFRRLDGNDDGFLSEDELPNPPKFPSDGVFADPVKLDVGSKAPNFEVPYLDASKGRFQLVDPKNELPTVLLMGNLTCPFFRTAIPQINRIVDDFSDSFRFVWVYTRESHALDSEFPSTIGWIEEPINLSERRSCAHKLLGTAELKDIPVALDNMKDDVARMYGADPFRFLLVDHDGTILYSATPKSAIMSLTAMRLEMTKVHSLKN